MSLTLKGAVLIFFMILSLSAKAGTEQEIDLLVRKGLEYCYHFQWNKAEKEFDQIIKKYPSDPRGYHYKSGIYLWYFLSSNQEDDLDLFLDNSDKAVNAGEKVLDNDPANKQINFTLGNVYTYRTLAYAKSESYLNAIWSSKKSEKFLNKVIEADPEMHDAYLGLGLYNFAAAQIPSAFKWALNLTGIKGDEETGIKFIKIAAEKGSLGRVEAQYYLSQLLTGVLFEYDYAEKMLKNLQSRYPENILFSYSLAVIHLKRKNAEEAGRILKKIINQTYPKFSQVIAFSNFLYGDVNFRMNNFDEAVIYYKKFLETSGNNDYTGIASLRLGYSYEIMNDRKSAVLYYGRTSSGNNDIEEDAFAKRKGSVYSKRELDIDEIALIKNSNLVEAGKFSQALKGLQQLEDAVKKPHVLAEVYYWISEAYYQMNSYEESVRYALKGASVRNDSEGWVNAMCYYNAARGELSMGNRKKMEENSKKASELNKYDYQEQISNLLNSLERQ
jgi:tetratricopeptide (TPR) repeat protein